VPERKEGFGGGRGVATRGPEGSSVNEGAVLDGKKGVLTVGVPGASV
jgi:hypothetical protein